MEIGIDAGDLFFQVFLKDWKGIYLSVSGGLSQFLVESLGLFSKQSKFTMLLKKLFVL